MSIWVHTLVKNEERYIWYALRSVVDFVDKMLIWDTGSSDATEAIIKEFKKIYPKKVDFRQVGEVNAESYTKVRQKMLDETRSDWIMILDGDEVWWDGSVAEVAGLIKERGGGLESIVTKYLTPVGDIFHYQPETAGRYKIDDKTGHLTIRFINRGIPGLYTAKPHGQHGYFDKNGLLIQDRDSKKRVHVGSFSFMHFTHMIRSTNLILDKKVIKREFKYKYELGRRFPNDFYYPEVFFKKKPPLVKSPWQRASGVEFARSLFFTAPKIIKRRLIRGESGY